MLYSIKTNIHYTKYVIESLWPKNEFGGEPSFLSRYRGLAILHAGPIIRSLGDEKYEIVSVGPTTSMRMEKFEYEFVEATGVRVIVGKGGMKGKQKETYLLY